MKMIMSPAEVLPDVTSQRGVEPSRSYKKNFVAFCCPGKHLALAAFMLASNNYNTITDIDAMSAMDLCCSMV
jgi:hypothetical protein